MRLVRILSFWLIPTFFSLSAVSQILPLSHEVEATYGRTAYSLGNKFHSSIHSWYKDELDTLGPVVTDSLSPLFNNRETFLYRKLFTEHLVEVDRSEEHTSELQSLMRISYAVFCLKKKKNTTLITTHI